MSGLDAMDASAVYSAPPQVLVVGDCMLDVYLDGAVHRISPEAPVPILRLGGQTQRPGGAANVALNLARLRCPCTLAGLVGADTAGAGLVALLDEPGITQQLVRAAGVQTTQKIRLVSQRQQLLRLDVESPPPAASVAALTALAARLSEQHRWVLLCPPTRGRMATRPPQAASSGVSGSVASL